MARFDVLFKKYVKNNDYKYNPNQSIEWNENNLRRMAFYENSCRALYEKTESTFGEDYAEFILTRVLKNDFSVTAFSKYPFKEYQLLTERVFMVDYLNKHPLKSDGNINAYTLITYFTGVVRELLTAMKRSGTVELYDFFICLGLMIEKWKITEYPRFITKRIADVELFMKQFIKHVIFSMFCPEGENQNITLVILDKKMFEHCVTYNGDYTVCVDKETGERIKATYDMYLEGIRIYLDIVKGTKNAKEYLQPAIRTYTYASNKLRAEFLEAIEKETGIDIGVIADVFANVQLDAYPQDMKSPEYKEAFKKLSEIKTNKDVNYTALRYKLEDIFATDYINYLNVVDKKLAYLLKQYDLDKNIASYETVYLKRQYEFYGDKYKGHFSEVTINAEYITKDCTSQDEYRDRLFKAVLDAHTINQMRVSLLYPPGSRPTNQILNVKLEGLEEDLYSFSYSIMYDACQFLKSTYMLPFTFSISQRVFFRDKSRVCYLTL